MGVHFFAQIIWPFSNYSYICRNIHRTDTVPVVREVERVRNVRYIPPWCRLLSGVGIGCLLYVLGRLFRRVAWQ